jgi:hypothetical protein
VKDSEPAPTGQGQQDLSPYPEVSPTGDAAVDQALHPLTSIPDLDDAAKHDAYERLHDDLLAELNTEHG